MSLIISHLKLVKDNILPSVQFYFQQKNQCQSKFFTMVGNRDSGYMFSR